MSYNARCFAQCHYIKGDLASCNYTDALMFTALEDLLDLLEKGENEYTSK